MIEPTYEGDFTFDESFALDSGDLLRPVTLRHACYGVMSDACDNVVLVCHALSGSARVGDWWGDLFERYPAELLTELNGARRSDQIHVLLSRSRHVPRSLLRG